LQAAVVRSFWLLCSASRVRHECVTSASQTRHKCATSASQMRHTCVINASRVRHECVGFSRPVLHPGKKFHIRGQSYDFQIYNYNSCVVVGQRVYISVFKTYKATRGVVNFYSAGAVTNDCRTGSRVRGFVAGFRTRVIKYQHSSFLCTTYILCTKLHTQVQTAYPGRKLQLHSQVESK
jgi:hypothetical protein